LEVIIQPLNALSLFDSLTRELAAVGEPTRDFFPGPERPRARYARDWEGEVVPPSSSSIERNGLPRDAGTLRDVAAAYKGIRLDPQDLRPGAPDVVTGTSCCTFEILCLPIEEQDEDTSLKRNSRSIATGFVESVFPFIRVERQPGRSDGEFEV